MARIKIKHKLDPNDRMAKQKLLEALANSNINICNLIFTQDGSIVAVTATDNDADTLLNYNNVQELNKAGFDPILPPEVKSRRTVICQRVVELIYEHSKNDIENEIETKNDWAKVKNASKFPKIDRNQYTIKIEFEDVSMAAKAENDGIRLFNMSIANHQIKREKYTILTKCMRCYKIELHPTSQCPHSKSLQICSECGGQDHTWRTCKSTQKHCLNCGQSHRTLAMSCPNRKEAIKVKERQQQKIKGTYAQVTNNSQTSNITAPMDLGTSTVPTMLFCLYSAHLMNAANPGSFQEHLDYLTKANNLPRLIGPQNPPSSDIINSILNNTIPRTHPNPQQSMMTEQQEEETEENSSLSESEEENNLKEEENLAQTRSTTSANNTQRRKKKNKNKRKKDNSQRTMTDAETKSKNNLQTQPRTTLQIHNLAHNTPTQPRTTPHPLNQHTSNKQETQDYGADYSEMCVDEPTVEGGETNWDSGKVWLVGSIVNVTCESDLRLLPDGNQTQQIQWTDQGWETGGPCQAACIEIPALVNAAGETWDENTWIVGDTVNISCPYSHLTPQGSTNVTHGCTDDGWTNSSYCIKVCLPPMGLPENMTWPEGVHEVGSVMTVSCPETYLTRDANDNSTYSCTDSGWHTPQPCIRVCLTEPEVNNSITAFDRREMWTDGDKMKVWCLPEHQVRPGITYYTISCTSTGWQEDHPQCLIAECSLSLSGWYY
ncbi:hypothetical protein Pcinc_012040 [Petrolisthes cinctipes]|uniref:Sushi domain-containing protein n=1 Tax=Petrolisthes cinctipes TaxID=88211 RepID=A0AAE1G1J2_PETCI|nr:hypothetical protein Pcinc_012040 [Petrolisthes cinctipes]